MCWSHLTRQIDFVCERIKRTKCVCVATAAVSALNLLTPHVYIVVCEITLRSKQDSDTRTRQHSVNFGADAHKETHARVHNPCTRQTHQPPSLTHTGLVCHVAASRQCQEKRTRAAYSISQNVGGDGVAHHPLNKFLPTRCAEYLLSVLPRVACQLMCRITTAPGSSLAS